VRTWRDPAANVAVVTATDPHDLLAGAGLAYSSDYLSFVGADAAGHVAFALDTNRGRDGDDYQAEHLYAVLHDEHDAWVDVVGVGRYANPDGRLVEIPDSPAFSFTGSPRDGLVVDSAPNALTLTVDPLVERTVRAGDTALFVMTSARAELRWRGRAIPGRVIHEYLGQHGANLMTQRSLRGFPTMEYLYLLLADADDLYVQKAIGAPLFAGLERVLGFTVVDEVTEQLTGVRFDTTGRDLARGAYRWPATWDVAWDVDGRRATLRLATVARRVVGNWGVAGLAMSVVRGTVSLAGATWPVYGFGELLVVPPLVRRLAP
jgi:hypothetical protein